MCRETTHPLAQGSTFSTHQNARAACWSLLFAGPGSDFWLFFRPVLQDDQVPPTYADEAQGVPSPAGSRCPSSFYLPSLPASLPQHPTPALPEASPKAPAAHSVHLRPPTRPGVALGWRGHLSIPGPTSRPDACVPTFWPRKRLLVESTVKPSAGVPSVVLSALAALLTSPCFFLHKEKNQCEAHTGTDHVIWALLTGR